MKGRKEKRILPISLEPRLLQSWYDTPKRSDQRVKLQTFLCNYASNFTWLENDLPKFPLAKDGRAFPDILISPRWVLQSTLPHPHEERHAIHQPHPCPANTFPLKALMEEKKTLKRLGPCLSPIHYIPKVNQEETRRAMKYPKAGRRWTLNTSLHRHLNNCNLC